MKSLITVTLLCLCANLAIAQEKKTPSHVFQQVQNVVADLEQIRAHQQINETPRVPGVQSGKLPLHVYGKSLEVMEKISRYQKKIGVAPVSIGQIPLNKITPSDVFLKTEQLLSELQRIKVRLNITNELPSAPLVLGKGPSDVYENLWRASYLLDGLAGQISPDDVFRNTQYIQAELSKIYKHLGVKSRLSSAAPVSGKTPEDVNLAAYKNLHKIGRLQRYLEIAPVRVPAFPAGDIRPSDVFDTTNMILAELVRVKVALGIKTLAAKLPLPKGKTPVDVFVQMQNVEHSLHRLLAHTDTRQASR